MRNSDSLSGFPLLHDYQLEEMWRTPQSTRQSQGKRGREGWNWRQRVQYAVGHALNEYFGMEVEVRREIPVQYVLEKWWPTQPTGFESLFHYWDVKNKVSGELSKICALNRDLSVPVMLYEQFCTSVPELEVDISLIVQAAWQLSAGADSLLIQKYIVDYNLNVIHTFQHLTNVFVIMHLVLFLSSLRSPVCWKEKSPIYPGSCFFTAISGLRSVITGLQRGCTRDNRTMSLWSLHRGTTITGQ